MKKIIVSSLFCLFLFGLSFTQSSFSQTVYVSRMWHNHQPIYWPEWNSNGSETSRIQFAADSIALKGGQNYGGLDTKQHPENDLNNIFGIDDRKNAYQSGPRNSLASIPSEGGFCISYSGSLMDNVRSLGAAGQLGYGNNWWDGNREARGWKTPSGSPRLDLVGFTYHHSLGSLLPKSVFRKEIQIFKQAWWKAWGGNSDLSDHSKGFFPTEMAFTPTMIDVLVDEGYEWSIVASHHLSRTCPTYTDFAGIEGGSKYNSAPPNKADQLGPSPTTGWWNATPNPGNGAVNVSPFAYQAHWVKYVNPTTGNEKKMMVVPSDDVMSYKSGYSQTGADLIASNIAPYATDSSRPVIVMPSTDGDNAWGGGSSSWFEATPGFFNDAKGRGYGATTPQDFLNNHPVPDSAVVHIEDGAWIFPESDYGSPYFLKWIEPPIKLNSPTAYPGTMVDLETPGFASKFWSWAAVITGANWCETAEQIWTQENGAGTVQSWKIQAPYDWDGTWTSPNVVELAWHIYLGGLDSGFNYYGGLGNDDEIKASLATTRAIEKLKTYIDARKASKDNTPPTVLKPQRFPWNPGGYGFGWFNALPTDNRYSKKHPSEFYIWTHAYDVSGTSSVNLKIRVDNDGSNTMSNNQNEIYAGGSDVGAWITIPMTKKALPNTPAAVTAAAGNNELIYFITPPEIADYYYAKISQNNVAGFRGKLLDYYIEATDTRGNVSKSDIQHVFVEDDGETPPTDPPTTPTGLTATASSSSKINLSWTASPLTVSYILYRDGVQVSVVSGVTHTDENLTSNTTYSYALVATNSAGSSAATPAVSAKTDDAGVVPPSSVPFVLDGTFDGETYKVYGASGEMVLHAAVRGSKLYVATWTPGNSGGSNDHFILISDQLLSSPTTPAPWAKAGKIAIPANQPFLAGESGAAYSGWFNAPALSLQSKAAESGGALEGTIDLVEAFGSMPTMVYIAAVAYGTDDGGIVGSQGPAGNSNNDIEASEFFAIPIHALYDNNADFLYDILDPKLNFKVSAVASVSGGNNCNVSWAAFPGKTYQVQSSNGLGAAWTWGDVSGAQYVCPQGQSTLSHPEPIVSSRFFYRVKLVP